MEDNKIHKLNTVRWKAVFSAVVGAVFLSVAIMVVQDRILLSRITDYNKLNTNIVNDKYVEKFEFLLNKTIIKLQTEAENISEQTTQFGFGAKKITQKMFLKFLEKMLTLFMELNLKTIKRISVLFKKLQKS